MNYIYCVPCHNLLLNKLTVLETYRVMLYTAARGQCGPVEVTGGAPVQSRYHRWMLRSVVHVSVPRSCCSVDLFAFVVCNFPEWMDLVSPARRDHGNVHFVYFYKSLSQFLHISAQTTP